MRCHSACFSDDGTDDAEDWSPTGVSGVADQDVALLQATRDDLTQEVLRHPVRFATTLWNQGHGTDNKPVLFKVNRFI